MTSLGILVTKFQQEQEYYTTMAQFGLTKDISTYLFLPKDIDPINKNVYGKRYCGQQHRWVNDYFPIPKFIYDRCFYENEASYKLHFPYVHWLKQQIKVKFLGYGLPNKWHNYITLTEDSLIQPYLPETVILTNAQTVFAMLIKHMKIIVKPVAGSQGKGIFLLEKQGKRYQFIAKRHGFPYQRQLTTKQVQQLLTKLVEKRVYVIQPFLSLITNQHCPFDIRIFLQKNAAGKWTEIGRGLRIGKAGDYTSNLSSGGEVYSYQKWREAFSTILQNRLETSLISLLQQIPVALEAHGHQLFELGIDIGIANDNKVWLLEVNSKPGRKVITASFPNRKEMLAAAPILYCLYLDAKNKELTINAQ